MFDVLGWPIAVVHLSPGVGLYPVACFLCGHRWIAIEKPGRRIVECPTCGVEQPEHQFLMPENVKGSDGTWIDPGIEANIVYLN